MFTKKDKRNIDTMIFRLTATLTGGCPNRFSYHVGARTRPILIHCCLTHLGPVKLTLKSEQLSELRKPNCDRNRSSSGFTFALFPVKGIDNVYT